jgi:hypothetical protein
MARGVIKKEEGSLTKDVRKERATSDQRNRTLGGLKPQGPRSCVVISNFEGRVV